MKVTVLEPSGYCVGVERAINLALKTREENPKKNVVILGMLVHNEDTLKVLENKGIKTVYKKDSSLEELINEINEPSIVILTAHGHSKRIEELLIKNGHTIVDATCPFVNKSMLDIENEIKKENDVFYIGVKNHPEANAALSLSKRVLLIDIKNVSIPNSITPTPAVITQTTLSEYEVKNITKQIKEKFPNAKILKGICGASTARQSALLALEDDVDLIYVVGGKNSNNSKTLFNIAKEKYPNTKVLLIQNEKDIKEKDLIGLSHVVISSGASTPKQVIEEIKSKLMN